jgi:hypothetical protein
MWDEAQGDLRGRGQMRGGGSTAAAGRRCAMAHAAACCRAAGQDRRRAGRRPAGRVVFIDADRSVGRRRRRRRRGRKKRQVESAPKTCGCGGDAFAWRVREIRPGPRRLGTWMRAWRRGRSVVWPGFSLTIRAADHSHVLRPPPDSASLVRDRFPLCAS